MANRCVLTVLVLCLFFSASPAFANGDDFDLDDLLTVNTSNEYQKEKSRRLERWGGFDQRVMAGCGGAAVGSTGLKVVQWGSKLAVAGAKRVHKPLQNLQVGRRLGKIGKVVSAALWVGLAGGLACLAGADSYVDAQEEEYYEKLFEAYLHLFKTHNSYDGLRETLRRQYSAELADGETSNKAEAVNARVNQTLRNIATSILEDGYSAEDVLRVYFDFLDDDLRDGLLRNANMIIELRSHELSADHKINLQRD